MLLEAIEQLFPDHNFRWERHGPCAKGFCPLHKNDHTPAFAIYIDAKGREKWHCFAEDIGGNLLDIVRRSGIPGTETIGGANLWMLQKGYLQETEQQHEDRIKNDALYKFYKWSNNLLVNSKQASGVRAYLAKRHIDIDTLPMAAVGYYPSLQEVRAFLAAEKLTDIIEQDVCVPEAKNLMVAGSIIFFYKTGYNEISRLKVRNVLNEKPGSDKHTFFLGAKLGKKAKLGYFSWYMSGIKPGNGILVEGEFDVGALASMIFRENPEQREPIYCFGGGGNISSGVDMITSMGLTNVYIFPDNDEPGINYAQDIAEAFPDTYTLFPDDYKSGADPAEWSVNHSVEDLRIAFTNRRPAFMWVGQKLAENYINSSAEEQAAIKTKIVEYGKRLSPTNREAFIKAFGSLAGVSLESVMQEIEEASSSIYRKSMKPEQFGILMNLNPRGKSPEWKQISNVIIEHVRDMVLDDYSGESEVQRKVVFRATTVNHSKEIDMPVIDFVDDKKFRTALTTSMGASSILIEPHMEAHLRNSMVWLNQQSHPKGIEDHVDMIYSHTGWRDGKYYTPTGYIDEYGFHDLEDIKVELPDLPPFFRKYYLDQPAADMKPIFNLIRHELLQVFPYEITLPFLAHIFWSVISYFCPVAKPYALWVVGQTGSFKTTYTGIMTSFFGDFKTADFETWRSTANAIEQNGFFVKDMPFVIDDYKGVDVKRENVTRIMQNYADKHGRSRMARGRNDKYEKTYWIRGNMIVTAEDVPPEGETSVSARTLELHVPTTGNAEHLTNAQLASKMLPGVMTKFIQFIASKHLTETQMEKMLAERRNQFQALHARIRENIAENSIAWDFVAEFFGFEDLTPLYRRGLNNILMAMNSATKSQQACEVYIDSLSSLLATGNFFLEACDGYIATPHSENAKRLGWINERAVYLIGPESIAEVNKLRMQVTGSNINYTPRAIYEQLLAQGKLVPDANGKASKNKRIDGFQYRVIELKRGVIEALDETSRDKIEPEDSAVRDQRRNNS